MTDITLGIIIEDEPIVAPMYMYVPVPRGGNTDYALLKRTDSDFDMKWGPVGGGATNIIRKAQGAIGGHRIVYSYSQTHVAYADPMDYLQVRKIIGITAGAANDGEDVVILNSGIVVEPSWSWSPGDIYLSSNGQLTQVRPTTGNLVLVGAALSPTVMQISIEFIVNLQ